ncbi:MAG TPA: ABC transporter permease [Acidimicrobiales bacterium]|nr:ABC transporter permease [Acidimicrobiales bacterium]
MTSPARNRSIEATTVRWDDQIGVGLAGIRARPARALLSVVGIAIGVAALISVFGISSSSRAQLLAEIDRLGTDVLEVRPGQDITGERVPLPVEAMAMLRRVSGVEHAAVISSLDVTVRRNDRIGEHITGGISVAAAAPDLLAATRSRLRSGRFLDSELAALPVVVLGDVAARGLAVEDTSGAPLVWLGGRWFTVVGILEPNPIADDLDRSALIGEVVARSTFDPDLTPSKIYVRTTPDDVERVRAVAAATAKPAAPSEVEVLRSADALVARAAAKSALNTLLLGLGSVTLVVGGIGIANMMIIAVLERRNEIGLRRALGATGRHIATQFLSEAAALGLVGGLLGALGGSAITTLYAVSRGTRPSLPAVALICGVAAAIGMAAVAGMYPAVRAARLSPAEALQSS